MKGVNLKFFVFKATQGLKQPNALFVFVVPDPSDLFTVHARIIFRYN